MEYAAMSDNKGMFLSILMAGAAMAAVAAAVVMWQKMLMNAPALQSTRNQALGLLYEFQHAAATPLHVLRQIAEHMAIEMHAGLMTEGKSNLLMLPTFVENLPDG